MKRAIAFAVLVLLTGCSYGVVNFATPELKVQQIQKATSTIATATQTLTPTATIGYQATALAAEATAAQAQAEADAAARLMVQSTAEYEKRLQEQYTWTMQADQWTATAMMTAVPMTSIAQANMNTAIAKQQSILSAQITQTHEAPTQVVAMNRANMESKMIPVDILARLFLFGAMGYFLIAVGYFAIHQTTKPAAAVEDIESIPQVEKESVLITLKQTNNGAMQWSRLVVPCAPDALSELAIGVLNDGKTLGINQWEGKASMYWTRETIALMRNFMLANKFAASDGNKSAVINDDGRAFLRGWLDNGALPHSFEFDPKAEECVSEIPHAHETHALSHAVGEA